MRVVPHASWQVRAYSQVPTNKAGITFSICSAMSQQQRCLSFLRAYSCLSKHRREAADLRAQQQGEAARSIATAAREAAATLQRLGKQQAAAAAERAEAKAKQDAIDEVRSDCIKLLWQPVQCHLPAVGTRDSKCRHGLKSTPVARQEARKFEAQKAEQWLPTIGDTVHVPRLGGTARVRSAAVVLA